MRRHLATLLLATLCAAPTAASADPAASQPTSRPADKAAVGKAAKDKAARDKAAKDKAAKDEAAKDKAAAERARRGLVGRLLFGRRGRAASASSSPRKKGWLGPSLVRRGIFDRPYLTRLGSAVAIGGYIDLLGSYRREEGIDAFGFEARRFNIFISSAIADFIRLTSELEFEHGTDEIALETALVDVRLHHALNLRAGILLVPLGRFNVAHDSPIYDVIDRPLVSTRIIPSTYSEVGFGLFGILYPGRHTLTYQLYLINGLGDGLLSADGTRLSAGRAAERFAFDENSSPALTGRVGWSAPFGLDVGLSFYSGVYTTPVADALDIDDTRWVHIFAFDFELRPWNRLTVRGEAALALIDVPDTLGPEYASKQAGFYSEAVVRLVQAPWLVFPRLALFGVARIDYVDLNLDKREGSDGRVGDETTRVSVGLSLRPAPPTSIRVVYYHEWIRDALGNAARAGAIQLGLASYF